MRVSTVVLGLVALINCVGEAYGRTVFGNDVLAPSLRAGLTESTERSGKEPNTELAPVHTAPHLSTTGEAARTLVERGRGARKAKSSRKNTKIARTRKVKGSRTRKKIAKTKKPKSGTSKTKPPKSGTSKTKPPKKSTSKTPKPTKTKQQASVKPYPGQKQPSAQVKNAKKAKKVKPVLLTTNPKRRVIKFKAPKATSQHKKGGSKTVKPVKNKVAARGNLDTLAKRSGNAKAITFEQWKLVFELVNAELKKNERITAPIIIMCYGGISALEIGARGEDGVSADVDFHFIHGTPPAVQTAFTQVIRAIYAANSHSLATDFMNTAIRGFINADHQREVSQAGVYSLLWKPTDPTRSRLWMYHGPFGISLAGKMDKMTNEILQYGSTDKKNLQDAVGFVEEAVNQNGGRAVTYSQIKKWSEQFGKTETVTRRNIHYTAQRIMDALPPGRVGFTSDILRIGDAYDSESSV